jgi:type IV pilus assembly protein PilC
MPIFAYRALTLEGEPKSGEETAETLDHLREVLAARDLILKSAREAKKKAGGGFVGGVSARDVASFNRELTVLIKAGISIPEALQAVASRPGQPKLENALRLVLAEVRQGVSLSDAAAKFPEVFDAPYRAMIATGEEAGALPECLARHQEYIDMTHKVRSQLSKAMVYPLVLMATLALVLTFLFVAVIPNFIMMYRDLGSALPMPTLVLISVAENFPIIAGCAAGAVILLVMGDRAWASSPSGAVQRARFLLKVPFVGGFRRASAQAQAARVLATLITSGATVPKALAVARASVSDRFFAYAFNQANDEVKQGESLSASLGKYNLFPSISLKMMAAGEASGSLDKMLTAIASHHDEELASNLSRVTSLVEPLFLLVAGLVVGGVIIAMYLPIFSLTELIK